jgi:glycosyltransferase involved in cell wall biosynthesis
MPSPVRVLAVIDSFSAGGAEGLLATLAAVADPAELEMSVAALAARHADQQALAHRFAQHGRPPVVVGFRRLVDPAAFVRLVQLIRRSHCDVVHAHLEDAAVVTVLAAGLVRRPCVVTLHHSNEPPPGRARRMEKLAIALSGRGAQRLIFVSNAALAAAAARHRRRRNWIVVENGVPLSAESSTRPPGGDPCVVLLGALRPGKGHEVALSAWPLVRAAIPRARLRFVGSGALEADLRAMATNVGVGDAVDFAGFRDDVNNVLADSDLVVLPSHFEAYPTVLLEAAAAGRAVVATRVGGIPEIVVDGVTGLLIPPADPAALARAVVRLLTHDDERRAMETAARRTAEEHFSAAVWAQRLGDLYREVRRP